MGVNLSVVVVVVVFVLTVVSVLLFLFISPTSPKRLENIQQLECAQTEVTASANVSHNVAHRGINSGVSFEGKAAFW